MGWSEVILIGCVISIVAHLKIQKFSLAVLSSSFLTAIIPGVIDYIRVGYMDAFWPIAFVMLFVASLLVSIVVGITIRGWKEQRNQK